MTNQTANTITESDAIRSVDETRKALKVPLALELLTAVGLALMAGFLFNMSVVTAPALNTLSPEQALAGWKGINSTVRNPLFAGTAFGTAVLVVACAAVAWRSQLRAWCLSFALLYVIGVIGTTFTVEVGINRAIVLATAPPPELPRMLSTWLLANHIRALSALAAFVVAWLGFDNTSLINNRARHAGRSSTCDRRVQWSTKLR